MSWERFRIHGQKVEQSIPTKPLGRAKNAGFGRTRKDLEERWKQLDGLLPL